MMKLSVKCLLFLALFSSLSSYSYAASYSLTQEQYQELKLTLNDSKNQLILLQSQLQTAEQQLNEAQQSVQMLSTELNIVNQSLTDSQNQITKLEKVKRIGIPLSITAGVIIGVGTSILIIYASRPTS